MPSLLDRYSEQINGSISCYDRIIITGTLIGVCYAQGMEAFLRSKQIRLIDFPRFAAPLREQLRQNAEALAQAAGIQIEFIRSLRSFRKEDRIQSILKKRGEHSGLVHIFSAMETCGTFEYFYNTNTGANTFRYKETKCLHYYFYFMHEEFGLCYMRVPTWAPFRLQFYCNGHNWLARKLKHVGIAAKQLDNTFIDIADFARAQAIADSFPVKELHALLDESASLYCPALHHFNQVYPDPYHWSVMQVEYATDIIFHRQQDLKPLYETLVRTAIHAVKPENIATFLGQKLFTQYQGEMGNKFNTRIEGTRLKHQMGPVSIKMYDKYSLVLRLEVTANDLTFFKHYREVEHRDHTKEWKLQPMRKGIYSLVPLRALLYSTNQSYLAFLSELTDPSSGASKVEKVAAPVRYHNRTYRGFNLFDKEDTTLFCALARGEWNISGFTNASLRKVLKDYTGSQLSRIIKRLHLHGLTEKVAHTYKYNLTALGRQTVLTALKLRELVVIPAMAGLL
jgi:hypothetical protein